MNESTRPSQQPVPGTSGRVPGRRGGLAAAAPVAAAVTTAVTTAALLLTGGASDADTARGTTGATRATPSFEAATFDHPQDNPWFPLRAGLVTRLRGSEDGVRYREKVQVTHRRRTVDGVSARVVRDLLRRRDGSLAERTSDWYAADDRGNVWYLGERTATFDRHGHLESREGSWQAGRSGAVPGLVMPADPHATDAYRQELRRGDAEDQAWIVGFKRSVRTPARRFHRVLRSFEWSRLEPGVVSQKLYARGVGIVAERDLAGGTETFALTSVRRPRG